MRGRAGDSPGWPEPGAASEGCPGVVGAQPSPSLSGAHCCSPLSLVSLRVPAPGFSASWPVSRTRPGFWEDLASLQPGLMGGHSPALCPSHHGLLGGTCPFSISVLSHILRIAQQRAPARSPVPTSPGRGSPAQRGQRARHPGAPARPMWRGWPSVAGGTTARSGARPQRHPPGLPGQRQGPQLSGRAEQSTRGWAGVGAPSP